MKAEIRWENEEKSIVRYTWTGEWNWDDFYRVLDRRATDLEGSRNVHYIIDFRQMTRPPSDAILHLKRAAKMAEETEKLIILITTSTTIVTLYNVFISMYRALGKRFRIVNNDAEAYAILGVPAKNGD